MPVPWKICHPSVVRFYLLLLNTIIAGGLMVLSAVSRNQGFLHMKQNMIQKIRSVLGEKYNFIVSV